MKTITFFVGIAFIIVVRRSSQLAINAENDNQQRDFHDSYVDCSSHADCLTPNSSCVEQRCQCPQNYVFNAAMTSCLKVAIDYGDACEETAQCTASLLIGGICVNGICSCATGYHYLHGRCFKSSGLEETCRINDDCYINGDYEALSCVNQICQCSNGFYKREYRTCRREANKIGAECTIDLDCLFDDSARCDRQEGCKIESENLVDKLTTENHHKISINDTSRILEAPINRSNSLVGSSCTSDDECRVLGAAICSGTGECRCKRGNFPNADLSHCVAEIAEKCELNDQASIKNSICRDGRWSCKGATVSSRNKRLCRKATTAYNSSCQFDEQCYAFGPDALCVNKKCLCSEDSHYSEEDMFCWTNKGVGERCKNDKDCFVNGFANELFCSEKSICACPEGNHVNAAGTACIKNEAAIGDSCTADEDCKSLQNSMCLNETCTCTDNYFDFFGNCAIGIGGPCDSNDDCKTVNSTCIASSCSCAKGFVSPSAGLCVPTSSFGNECTYDVQCRAMTWNAICALAELPESNESTIGRTTSKRGICSCEASNHYRNERCYRTRVLGEACNSLGECYVQSDDDSVVCLKGVCSCGWNKIRINDTICKSGVPSLYLSSCWTVPTVFFLLIRSMLKL